MKTIGLYEFNDTCYEKIIGKSISSAIHMTSAFNGLVLICHNNILT